MFCPDIKSICHSHWHKTFVLCLKCLKRNKWEIAHHLGATSSSQSLTSTLVDFPSPNSPISNGAVQYYSTELDDCHHISSEMNKFLALLEDGNLINWKQVGSILFNACQCCPVNNDLIQNSDLVLFVDRHLTQCLTFRMQTPLIKINSMDESVYDRKN